MDFIRNQTRVIWRSIRHAVVERGAGMGVLLQQWPSSRAASARRHRVRHRGPAHRRRAGSRSRALLELGQQLAHLPRAAMFARGTTLPTTREIERSMSMAG